MKLKIINKLVVYNNYSIRNNCLNLAALMVISQFPDMKFDHLIKN